MWIYNFETKRICKTCFQKSTLQCLYPTHRPHTSRHTAIINDIVSPTLYKETTRFGGHRSKVYFRSHKFPSRTDTQIYTPSLVIIVIHILHSSLCKLSYLNITITLTVDRVIQYCTAKSLPFTQ